jgi:hypothetical protein
MLNNMIGFNYAARRAVVSTAQSENKITWVIIKEYITHTNNASHPNFVFFKIVGGPNLSPLLVRAETSRFPFFTVPFATAIATVSVPFLIKRSESLSVPNL